MDMWLKRALFLFLISLGLVCLVSPFHFYRLEGKTREVVKPRLTGLVDNEEARSSGALAAIREFSREELKAFPTVYGILTEKLDPEGNSDLPAFHKVPGQEALDLYRAIARGADDMREALIFEGHLFTFHSFEASFAHDLAQSGTVSEPNVGWTTMGIRISSPIPIHPPDVAPVLSREFFASWPNVRSYPETGGRP